MLPEVPLRRIHLPDLFPVAEHGRVRRDHLLLTVVGDADVIEADGERADLRLLAGLEQHLLVLLEAFAGEPQEHQDNADVDDIAAVAALVARHETDERGEHVGAGSVLADPGAAPELLADCPDYEPAQRETDSGCPDADAKRSEEHTSELQSQSNLV